MFHQVYAIEFEDERNAIAWSETVAKRGERQRPAWTSWASFEQDLNNFIRPREVCEALVVALRQLRQRFHFRPSIFLGTFRRGGAQVLGNKVKADD